MFHNDNTNLQDTFFAAERMKSGILLHFGFTAALRGSYLLDFFTCVFSLN